MNGSTKHQELSGVDWDNLAARLEKISHDGWVYARCTAPIEVNKVMLMKQKKEHYAWCSFDLYYKSEEEWKKEAVSDVMLHPDWDVMIVSCPGDCSQCNGTKGVYHPPKAFSRHH